MGEVTTIGLDLAKHVFQVHGVDAEGATVLRKQFRRAQVRERRTRLLKQVRCPRQHLPRLGLQGLASLQKSPGRQFSPSRAASSYRIQAP
jgi:hypothetical protein